MRLSRLALVLPIAALILGGCELRGSGSNVVAQEDADEQGRIASENARLADENRKLKSQLDNARGTLSERKGGTIGDELGGAAKDIEGFSATGDGAIALSDDFSFAKGSADLNAEGRRSIEKLAEKLNSGDLAGAVIRIEGHTDSTPVARPATKAKFGDNMGLSKARAESVAEALIGAGVAADRLQTAGLGDTKPRSSGKSKEDQAKNRRVELRVQR
jgi:outer membrane protein OmpA-like peptidoglycan-associated protein